MKKFNVGFMVLLAAFMLFSCKGTPPKVEEEPQKSHVIEGEVTEEKIEEALEEIYEEYQPSLDMTDAQSYTVAIGDTLVSIAQRFYGSLTDVGEAGASNGFYFPIIMLGSEHDIADPDLIHPGMVLMIPDLKRNLDNPAAHQAIKDFLKEVAYIYNKKGNSQKEAGLIGLADSL